VTAIAPGADGAADLGLVTLRGCGYFDFIPPNLLAQYGVRVDDDERALVSGRQPHAAGAGRMPRVG